MSSTFTRITIVGVVLVALALAVALAACGSSDKYSGTWTAKSPDGTTLTFKIEKSGDKWKVSDPTSKDSQVIEGTEENGKLTLKNPSNASEVLTLERKGDKLVMSMGGVSIEFTKQ